MESLQFIPGQSLSSLAIIGSGPSTVFLLKQLLERAGQGLPREITIFEKDGQAGVGMPYSARTTDPHHLSNISSEEIPALQQSFAEWLGTKATPEQLAAWAIRREEIDPEEIYPRLALGAYFQSQYCALVAALRAAGVAVKERVNSLVLDVVPGSDGSSGVEVVLSDGARHACAALVIATGHRWPQDDRPDDGYFASPWPIRKILPPPGRYYDFPVGILGASLSAFDVVTTLAHHHGDFSVEGGQLSYQPRREAQGLKLVLHAADGALPHLLFEQTEPLREIYRHVSREQIEGLIGADGFLPLIRYFDEVCRPVLIRGFLQDGRADIAKLLEDASLGLEDLVEKLAAEHQYDDPFEGLAVELAEAERLVREGRVTHWKEYLDDLFYTLNFHAESLAAEDHDLLKGKVLPFVMSVVAAMPLDSVRKLLALRNAGMIELRKGKAEIDEDHKGTGLTRLTVDDDGEESEERYRLFIDCGGQKPSSPTDHPFRSLVTEGGVVPASARFRDPGRATQIAPDALTTTPDGAPALLLGGLQYDRHYLLQGAAEDDPGPVFDLALPDVNGLRPYSYGLQACNEAAAIVASCLVG